MPSPANTRPSSNRFRLPAAAQSRFIDYVPRQRPDQHRAPPEPVRQWPMDQLGAAEPGRKHDDDERQIGRRRVQVALELRKRRQHRVDAERADRHQRRDQRDEFGKTNGRRILVASRLGAAASDPLARAGGPGQPRKWCRGPAAASRRYRPAPKLRGESDEHLWYDQGRDLRIEHPGPRAGASSHARSSRRGPAAARAHLRRPNSARTKSTPFSNGTLKNAASRSITRRRSST